MKNGIKTKLKKEYQSVKQSFSTQLKFINHLLRQRKFWKIQLLNIWTGLATVIWQVALSMLILFLTAKIIKSMKLTKLSGTGEVFINTIILTLFYYKIFLVFVAPIIKAAFNGQFSKLINPQLISVLLMMPFMIKGPVHAVQQNFYPSLYSVLSLWLLFFAIYLNKRILSQNIREQLENMEEFQGWIPYISKMSSIKEKTQTFDKTIDLVRSEFYTGNNMSVEVFLKYSRIGFGVTYAGRTNRKAEQDEFHELEFEDWPLLLRGSSKAPTKLNQKKGKEKMENLD